MSIVSSANPYGQKGSTAGRQGVVGRRVHFARASVGVAVKAAPSPHILLIAYVSAPAR
jgi:hypothetical protein